MYSVNDLKKTSKLIVVMLQNAIKFILFFSLVATSLVRADDCAITIVEQTPESTTYQLCINLEKNIRLDVSSVCFESDSPQIQIKSWRLINATHDTVHGATKKILSFQITTTPPSPEAHPFIHTYFLELEDKIPHHYTIPLNTTVVPTALPTIQAPNIPVNQDDYLFSQKRIRRGLFKVLKAPFTGVQYLTMLMLSILNAILHSWMLLFLIILLLGFLMGLIPLFFPTWIMSIVLNHSNKNKFSRLGSSAAYAGGFCAAMLLQATYFLNHSSVIENSAFFTIGASAANMIFAFILLGKITIFNHMRIPSFAYIPIGFFMGIISTAFVFMGARIMAPWLIAFLRFVQEYHAIPFLVLGLSLFILLIGWCAQPLIASLSKEWLTEYAQCASYIFGLQALAILCSTLPHYIMGTMLISTLTGLAIIYAWQSTAPIIPSIQRFRKVLSIISLCSAIVIASKLMIMAWC
jgi:hypothetical protein